MAATLLLGRYELLNEDTPKHRSATSIVLFAIDRLAAESQCPPECVLKLMRNRDQWDRELKARGGALEPGPNETRQRQRFSPEHVMPVLRAHELSAEDASVLREDMRGHTHALVLPRGEEDLESALAHNRMSLEQARGVARGVAMGVQHFHAKAFIHGDIKPLNIVRVKGAAGAGGAEAKDRDKWVLIDLDATAAIFRGHMGLKCSTAFAPPELLYKDPHYSPIVVTPGKLTPPSSPIADASTGEGGPAAAGGAGWRVRAVDESGNPLDTTAAAAFESLRAQPSFDMWSFGAVLFELLMRSRLWHSDADGNLSNPDDYRKLAEWSADAAREAVSRVPDRWGQALLVRLLAPSAEARPRSMASVLQHPFFKQRDQFVAPPLAEGEGHHLFLCHAPGNACATAIKGAVQEAVPGASVWLDQDHRDANEAAVAEAVRRCQSFAVYLTEGVFARPGCQVEIRTALEAQKPVVLVRETDPRQGAPRPFAAGAAPAVRCAHAECGSHATHGGPGAAWPSLCGAHAAAGFGPLGLNPARVSDELLAYALAPPSDGSGAEPLVDAAALELASQLLGEGATGEKPAPHALVRGDVKWHAEPEFRGVCLPKVLAAAGMHRAAGGEQENGGGDGHRSEAEALGETLRLLSMGAPAPPLLSGLKHHVCIVHDPACASAHAVCTALHAALPEAFDGAKVYIVGKDASELPSAAAASMCVVPFITRGLLKPGSVAAAAVSSGLRSGRRIITMYETELERGGCNSVQELIDETAPEAKGLWEHSAFPWLGADADAAAAEACALRLVLDLIMDEAPKVQQAAVVATPDKAALQQAAFSSPVHGNGNGSHAPEGGLRTPTKAHDATPASAHGGSTPQDPAAAASLAAELVSAVRRRTVAVGAQVPEQAEKRLREALEEFCHEIQLPATPVKSGAHAVSSGAVHGNGGALSPLAVRTADVRASFDGGNVAARPVTPVSPSGGRTVKPALENAHTLAELKIWMEENRKRTLKDENAAPPGGITFDQSRLEDYLTDAEFERVFGESRENFRTRPKWKQLQLKKAKGVF